MAFDPGGVAEKNGRFFGFPYSEEEADILILPAPWDVTTSYRDGTSRGPAAILAASTQLDFTSPFRESAWETRIGTLAPPPHWLTLGNSLRPKAKEVISALEEGREVPKQAITEVNEEGARFHGELEALARKILGKGRKLVTLGGDHSVSYGPIKAHLERHPGMSVLHIDAHADLRPAYCGFPHSHASVMHLVRSLEGLGPLVQVGLRDISPAELQAIESHPGIFPFFDWDLKREMARGNSWQQQCRRILEPLGREVYLSVDVDGLDPRYCPGTGTPVPGGIDLWELFFLLEELEASGRRLVGADLVEVAPGNMEWDANVGARILFQLCQLLRS
jgi:agmatinase